MALLSGRYLLRLALALGAVACAALDLVVASGPGGISHRNQTMDGPNRLSEAERRDGWTLLFDGATLDGWRGYRKPDASSTRWKAEGGLLTVGSADGRDTRGALDLITRSTFDEFELAFEWRVAPGANSGVKYFVLEDRDAAIGHEYQIIDDERHKDAQLGPKRQTASLYDVLAPERRQVRPAGDFNDSRVIVRGSRVEHWLNGASVLRYELGSAALQEAIESSKFKGIERFGKPQDGHILLQDHGDQVWYRNLKIRRFDS